MVCLPRLLACLQGTHWGGPLGLDGSGTKTVAMWVIAGACASPLAGEDLIPPQSLKRKFQNYSGQAAGGGGGVCVACVVCVCGVWGVCVCVCCVGCVVWCVFV